jgi:hypothetical protein
MAGLGIVLSLLSTGLQYVGSLEQAQEQKKIRQKLLERSTSLDSVFNKEYNQNYMDTPGVKNVMASYAEGLKKINKDAEGRAAMAGVSPEAVIAEKEKTNQNYGDFLRKIAGGQDQYKAEKERMYSYRRDALDNLINTNDQQALGRWDNLMSNASNLGTAGIAAGAIQKSENQGTSAEWLNGLFKKKGPKGYGTDAGFYS